MGLINELKAVSDTLQKIGQVDLYQKITPLIDDIIKIRKQNIELKEENANLKEKLKIKDSLVFKDNCYYTIDEEGKIKDGPFCSSCWDNEGKLIHHHITNHDTVLVCPVCKNYGGKSE